MSHVITLYFHQIIQQLILSNKTYLNHKRLSLKIQTKRILQTYLLSKTFYDGSLVDPSEMPSNTKRM